MPRALEACSVLSTAARSVGRSAGLPPPDLARGCSPAAQQGRHLIPVAAEPPLLPRRKTGFVRASVITHFTGH